MTFGACNPEAFRSDSGGRVFGYVVGHDPSDISHSTSRVMYLGAQHVYADLPHGNVRYRKGLARLRKVMRPGDRLILSRFSALGKKPCRVEKHIADIEASGIEVMIVRPEYFHP